MLIAKEEVKDGIILLVREKEQYYFYLAVGYNKKEIKDTILKASLLSKDKVYNLVIDELKDLMLCVKLMPVTVLRRKDDSVLLENESKTLTKLLQKVQRIIKDGISLHEKEVSYLRDLEEYYETNNRVKLSSLRKFYNNNFICKEDVVTLIDENYVSLHNSKSAKKLEVRHVYCYRGNKTARFYLYVGKDNLYFLTCCCNTLNSIRKTYLLLQKEEKEQGGIFLKLSAETNKYRGLYNKGNRIELYDTGIVYNSVYISDFARDTLAKKEFKKKDFTNLGGETWW